jgi:hypothetical protein
MGRQSVKNTAPMRPPIIEDKKAALRALAAWPCLANDRVVSLGAARSQRRRHERGA